MVLCYFKIKKLKRIYFCDTIIRTRSVISLKKAIAVCLAAAMIFGTVSMISAGAKTVKAGDADLNGKVNVVDATIIQMNVAGLNEFSDAQKTVADLDKNGKIEITDATTVQKISAEQEINDEQFEISDEPFTEPPTEPVYTDEEIESKGSQAMNDFSVKLLKGSVADDENTLVSPLSVMYALGMTENGANGNTLREMENTLGMPRSLLISYLKSYPGYLSNPNQNSTMLNIANSVWYNTSENSAEISSDYIGSVKDSYNAEVFPTMFNEPALENINSWVSEKTDDMIPSILSDIDPSAMMYLINAITFDAKWNIPYVSSYYNPRTGNSYPGDVRKGTFTNSDGTESIVDFMESIEDFYLKDDYARGFVKYYDDGNYAFAAILPDEGVKLNDYVNSLTGERLTNILNNMSVPESGVDTKLPKFEVEYNDELSDNLQALGMKEAFTSNADFKNMLADKNAASPFVSEVLHKTVISVNEEGTRAAAVTATINIGSASGDEDRQVYLDRPFLYMIINTKTNTPIFIGTVENLPNVEN